MTEAKQKTGFLGLALVFLGLVGIAIAAGFAGAGCSPSGQADRDEKPDWFQEPTGPLVTLEATESSQMSLSGDASALGNSSFSMNYRCGTNLCSCRDTSRKTHDCAGMIVEACAGLPHCVDLGPGKGMWCVCRAFPPGGGTGGCPSCPIAAADMATIPNEGWYKFAGGDGTVWRQHPKWDNACAVLGSQWTGLPTSVQSSLEIVDPATERGKILADGLSARFCTNAEVKPVEAALQAPPNGLYRTSDGAIRLLGQQPDEGPALRACQLSWHQFHNLMPNQADGSDPRYTDITGLTATNFVHWYTGNVAPCKDMEVATAQ